MKKCFMFLLIGLLLCAMLSAQTVSEERPFFAAVHQLSEEYVGRLDSADISASGATSETYILRGIIYAWSRWEGGLVFGEWHYYGDMYTVTITKDNSGKFKITVNENSKRAEFNKDYSEQLTDWENRNQLGTNADNLIADFTNKLNSYLSESDAQYEEYINSALTDPQFLYGLSKSKNALWMKTFMKRNNIIGRTATMTVKVTAIEESDDYNYLYKLLGTVGTANKATGEVAVPVVYYSNDDAVIDASKGRTLSIVAKVVEIEMSSEDGSIIAFKLAD